MAHHLRFQHTYEGLKPGRAKDYAQSVLSFQHTYEGLKQKYLFAVLAMAVRFQHTYEGLKPPSNLVPSPFGTSFSAYL